MFTKYPLHVGFLGDEGGNTITVRLYRRKTNLHHPLHVGFLGDEGGNTITVRWYRRKTNLHHLSASTKWVDNHLVHVLSPNIYRTTTEALQSFDYITSHGNFSFTERIIAKYAGAASMYFVSKKLKKRHNITDERAALYEAAETWADALKGRQFLGGSQPKLVDLVVFGVLRPIRHLKSGEDMVENTRIGEWYNGMEISVGPSSRIKE